MAAPPILLAFIVVASAKFGKQGDESKRNFAAPDEISLRNFVPAEGNFVSLKRNFVC